MAHWFTSNAGWFGPAVAVVLAGVGWLLQSQRKHRGGAVSQQQKARDNSTNIQIATVNADPGTDQADE